MATRYDDPGYVRDFLATGALPRIHRDIVRVLSEHARGVQCAFDMGSSTGLLSAALHRLGVPRVFGFETDEKALAIAPRLQGVGVFHYGVYPLIPKSMADFGAELGVYQPQLVVMRRVLPEISGGSLVAARAFARCLAEHNVGKVVLEGRIFSRRSTHPLANIDREIEMFTGLYELIQRYRNVAVLQLVADV